MTKQRILVIDDEESIRFTLQNYLGQFGYEVITADNPQVCSSLRDNRSCTRTGPCVDVVLVDLHMPVTDGLAYLESRIRYGCPNLARRMALISGNLSQEVKERVRETGAACFQKPVPLTEIYAWIVQVTTE